MTRRRWLRGVAHTSLVTGTNAGFFTSTALKSQSAGPNDTVTLGVIGIGARGKYLIGNLPNSTRVAAICDCALARIESAKRPAGEFVSILDGFKRGDGATCTTYQDYRQMLDREKLDAVIIATPDHHHVVAATRALASGLHVYLEKPLSLTVREGRHLVQMVMHTGLVLQVGSQQRTMQVNRIGCEFIRNGGLGRIKRVELPCYPGPLDMPQPIADPVPEGLDWDLFLGPAVQRPHARQLWIKDEFKVERLLWRGWDLYRDYSGHMMTNWGAHSVDMVQLALGRDASGPISIEAVAPENLNSTAKSWGDKTPLPSSPREQRFWQVKMQYDDDVTLDFTGGQGDIRFFGEKGEMQMARNEFKVDSTGKAPEMPGPEEAARWVGNGHVARPHLENWLAAIRGHELVNAPVEAGHRTATVCHLANIARQIQRPIRWNPETEQILNDAAANELLNRTYRRGFEPILPNV